MSETPYDLYSLVEAPPRRLELLQRAFSLFNAPETGVAVLLDKEESFFRNRQSRTQGAYGPLDRLTVADIARLTDNARQVACSERHNHLIWVARRIAESTDDVEFAWVVAHELRHLEQWSECWVLSGASEFIGRHLEALGMPNLNISMPVELDAELAAWRAVRRIFPQAEADSYPIGQSARGPSVLCYQELLKRDPDAPYDVRRETLAILTDHGPELRQLQQESDNPAIQRFSIEGVCREIRRSLEQG